MVPITGQAMAVVFCTVLVRFECIVKLRLGVAESKRGR